MKPSVYIARQPIYDAQRNIYAYELLYRETAENRVLVKDNLQATARVLINALYYIGLSTLTKGKKAFIKVDDKALMDDIIYSISPIHFVLEILETSVISPKLIERINRLRKLGYHFVLNHYEQNESSILHFHSILKVIDYIKIDLNELRDPSATLASLEKYNLKYMAEKIEDNEMFEQAKALGFHYFQGYFFAKPYLFKNERVDPHSSELLKLIFLLQTDATMEKLIEKFNASPYLTMSLLKFIRIHEGIGQGVISSVEQALVFMGRERLNSWLELMVYASGDEESEHAKQLSQLGKQRACLMKELAVHLGKNHHFEHAAYMTGLLSMSETMFEDGLDELVKQTHIDKDIASALLKSNGELGQLLQLAIAVEQNNLHRINSISGQLGLSHKELNECVLASYRETAPL